MSTKQPTKGGGKQVADVHHDYLGLLRPSYPQCMYVMRAGRSLSTCAPPSKCNVRLFFTKTLSAAHDMMSKLDIFQWTLTPHIALVLAAKHSLSNVFEDVRMYVT